MYKSTSIRDNLRSMILVGLFVAMGITLQYFSITLPIMRISISPIPTIVSGILLGPVWGGLTGVLKDLVGFLMAPPETGAAFFPPITIVQMLYGILPPLLIPVFRRPVDWVWGHLVNIKSVKTPALRWLAGLPARLLVCYLAVATTQYINGGLLMPAALSILINGHLTLASWLGLFTSRIPQQVISLVGYPALTYAIVDALDRVPVGRRIRGAILSRH